MRAFEERIREATAWYVATYRDRRADAHEAERSMPSTSVSYEFRGASSLRPLVRGSCRTARRNPGRPKGRKAPIRCG